MPRKKTLQKQGKSLKDTYPKKGLFAEPYTPGEDLSLEDLKEGIKYAFSEGDHDSLQGAISILLRRCDSKEITKKTGFSKTDLKKMCLPYPPPNYEAIEKILKFLTFKTQTLK